MLPLFTDAFFFLMTWKRLNGQGVHLPARPMGRGTRWLPCVGSPLLAPSRAVHEACAAPQHCSSPIYQVGTNESLVPRPSVLTGDPGEGEAQMAPPMHCVPCALQTPGAGLPGEAEPPACGPRWRWNVSCSGSRPGGRGPGWRRTCGTCRRRKPASTRS